MTPKDDRSGHDAEKRTQEPEPAPVHLDPLVRDLIPPAGLEDRVVSALRSEGLVRPGGSHRRLRAPWMVAAVAAAVALFAGGFAVGQYTGGRSALEAVLTANATRGGTPAERAAMIQQTGTLYVEAMNALQATDTYPQGREVALATLRAAVTELARLSPDDGRLARILAILNATPSPADRAARSTLWF